MLPHQATLQPEGFLCVIKPVDAEFFHHPIKFPVDRLPHMAFFFTYGWWRVRRCTSSPSNLHWICSHSFWRLGFYPHTQLLSVLWLKKRNFEGLENNGKFKQYKESELGKSGLLHKLILSNKDSQDLACWGPRAHPSIHLSHHLPTYSPYHCFQALMFYAKPCSDCWDIMTYPSSETVFCWNFYVS